MSFIRIWVHLIWSTKNREIIISKELKQKLINHIITNSKEKNIWLDSLNCVGDHIHLLVSLGGDQSSSKITMLIKGESSHWINQNGFVNNKFEWQDDYMAVSVSESNVDKVRKYIHNQEEHHHKKSFSDEYDEFMKKFGVKILSE